MHGSAANSQPGAVAARSGTLRRYWLFQIPGLMIVSALLAGGAYWFSLPLWACLLGLALWIVKDAAMYPFLKSAYEGSKPTGPATLIGRFGTATQDLRPAGMVRIGPELWKAECAVHVEAGRVVQVAGCDGMTLRVVPGLPGEGPEEETPSA